MISNSNLKEKTMHRKDITYVVLMGGGPRILERGGQNDKLLMRRQVSTRAIIQNDDYLKLYVGYIQ